MQGSKHVGFQKIAPRTRRKSFKPAVALDPKGSCEGKLAYTAEQAEKARRSRLRLGKATDVYRCPYCKNFHISGGKARRRNK